jgi:uncharacterized protein (UPF0264 family)
MTQLLVSVRSPEEALAALAGGADLIDIKEPAHGSLGRATNDTIAAIIAAVNGCAPVSAALGEWHERTAPSVDLPNGLSYAKWGLSHVRDLVSITEMKRSVRGATPVLVAYADWQRANGLSPLELVGVAVQQSFDVFLIDTFIKDGSTLLDWLTFKDLQLLWNDLAQQNIRLALAGSLQQPHLVELRSLRPTWFAVRGAACRDGERAGIVCEERVRGLKRLVGG